MIGRTKLFAGNSLAAAIQQLVLVAAGLIIPRFLIVNYGSDINGLIVSLTQIISYFVLVEAGISGASVFSLYKPLADFDIPAINAILSAARKFYLQSGRIFLALVAILSLAYLFLIKGFSMPSWQVSLLVLALGMAGAVDFFSLSKYRVLLTASQRAYVLSSATIVYWSINIILVFILSRFKVNIVVLEFSLLLSVLARSFILSRYTLKNFPYINYKEAPDNSSLKDRWSVLYLQILGSAQIATPVIIATIFTTLPQVSVFGVYMLIAGGISSILGIFGSNLSASFGDVIARKQRDILQKAYSEFEQAYYAAVSVIYSTALLLIIPFIKIYTKSVTDINYVLPALAFLFVLNGLMYSLKNPQGLLVISAGQYRQTRIQSSAQALIAIIGAAVGAYFFGLAGILFGLIASNLYRDIDLFFWIPKKVTHLSPLKTLKHIWPIAVIFSIASIIFFSRPIQTDGVFQWLLCALALVSLITAAAILLNLAADFKNMQNIFLRIISIARRKSYD
jgi:hypothetical protein